MNRLLAFGLALCLSAGTAVAKNNCDDVVEYGQGIYGLKAANPGMTTLGNLCKGDVLVLKLVELLQKRPNEEVASVVPAWTTNGGAPVGYMIILRNK